MSITSKIMSHRAAVSDSWHTPGHKGLLWADDISEIANGEIFPSDEIEKAQEYAAEAFGAKAVRFLTGGSSMGVKAAILAVDGDIIAAKNSHRSVFDGAALAKRKVFCIENEYENDLPLPPNAERLDNAMKIHPTAKAVVITTPDYFGRVSGQETAELIRSRGRLLIADSAHGAHMPFRPDLFPFSFSSCADFCNMSAHKTLFSLTMGAYLCVNNTALIGKIDEALGLLGTTSPLYPLLASLENAVSAAILQRGAYDKLKTGCDRFRHEIQTAHSDDFTRLVVDAGAYGLSGKQLYYKLYDKGIAAEMFTKRHVVFIATPADGSDKFDRLIAAVKESNER